MNESCLDLCFASLTDVVVCSNFSKTSLACNWISVNDRSSTKDKDGTSHSGTDSLPTADSAENDDKK